MEKVPKREEVNTPLDTGAEGKTASPSGRGRGEPAVACNFRRAGSLTQDQAQAIRTLHDTFARGLVNSLGAHVRGAFEVTVSSVEQLAYPEFLERIPKPNFVCSIALHPLETLAAVELELPLALALVDMLLGGPGSPVSEAREVTDIEGEILAGLVELICTELAAAWSRVLTLDFRLDRRLKEAQIPRLMSPREKVLFVPLEIRTGEVRGRLSLAFPAVAANALLRKSDEQDSVRVHADTPSDNRQLRNLLEQCPFHAELLLPVSAVPARKLLHLKVGDVLEFPLKADVPILFKVENQALFLAHPVATSDRRAAEIHAKLVPRELAKEETH